MNNYTHEYYCGCQKIFRNDNHFVNIIIRTTRMREFNDIKIKSIRLAIKDNLKFIKSKHYNNITIFCFRKDYV